MFKKIGTVSLFVSDQKRAKEFYTDKLGFELRSDEPMYPGATVNWIAVAPEGAETELVLYEMDENWQHYKQVIGKSQAITLQVDDVEALVKDLKGKGVEFEGDIDEQPWGTFTRLIDSEGNHILIVEMPKS